LTDRRDRKSSRVGRSRQVGRTSRFAVERRLPAKLFDRAVNLQQIRQTERPRLEAPDAAASRRPDCAGGRTRLERPRLGVGAQRRVSDVVGTNWPAAWASRTEVHVDEVPVPVTGHLNAEAKYVLPFYIAQFLQEISEIISVWTVLLSVTACALTMLALMWQFVPATALYKLAYLHYITVIHYRHKLRTLQTLLKTEMFHYVTALCDL